jgi:hypothetical protein
MLAGTAAVLMRAHRQARARTHTHTHTDRLARMHAHAQAEKGIRGSREGRKGSSEKAERNY